MRRCLYVAMIASMVGGTISKLTSSGADTAYKKHGNLGSKPIGEFVRIYPKTRGLA